MSRVKFVVFDLRISTTGVELELPLYSDGKMPQAYKYFRSLESLTYMWRSVSRKLTEGKPLKPAEADASALLQELLLNCREGPKLLLAMREFRRRQLQRLFKQEDDYDTLKAAEGNVDGKLDPYDSEARQLRRVKTRWGKLAE